MKATCPECEGIGLITYPELGGQEGYCPRCDGRGEVEDFIAQAKMPLLLAHPCPAQEDELHDESEILQEAISERWILRLLRDGQGQVSIRLHDEQDYDPRRPQVAISVFHPDQLVFCYMHNSVEVEPFYYVLGEEELPSGLMIVPRQRSQKKKKRTSFLRRK